MELNHSYCHTLDQSVFETIENRVAIRSTIVFADSFEYCFDHVNPLIHAIRSNRVEMQTLVLCELKIFHIIERLT